MKKFYMVSGLATVMVGCAFNASATFTDVYYTIANPANASGGQYNGTSGYQDLDSLNVKFGGNSYNGIFSGGIYITQPAQPAAQNDPTMPESYLTVCTDFLGTLYLGKTYKYSDPASTFTTVLSTQNGQTGGGIDPNWINPAQAIQNAAHIFYTYGDIGNGGINTAVGGTPLTVDQMAALQVAIWIALYDTTGTGAVDPSGTFQYLSTGVTDPINGFVTQYLSSLDGSYLNTGYLLQPDPLSGPGRTQGNSDGQLPQELLMGSQIAQGQGNPSVPEPTTIFAAAALLLPLGASTIRILRKSKNN
jgi:hypothetical protein